MNYPVAVHSRPGMQNERRSIKTKTCNQNTIIMKKIILFLSLVISMSISINAQDKDFPNLTGPYLGQKPPGLIAQLFAPGVVSTEHFEHSSPVFTPDLKELYWSTQLEENGRDVAKPIYFMRMVNGVWTKPERVPFSNQWPCAENPFISIDGSRLFFMASDNIRPEKADIFYVNRTKDSWSDPINPGEPINGPETYEGQPTVSKNGTLYYISSNGKAAGSGLFFSRLEKGRYQKPIYMDKKFNNLEDDWTPYIAPDERYFIFSSFRKGGYGSGDLYICFKQKDGTWGAIINMGNKINTIANERFPNVTPDGKYLFFNSTRKIPGANANNPGNGKGDVYWISAKIIEDLIPKE